MYSSERANSGLDTSVTTPARPYTRLQRTHAGIAKRNSDFQYQSLSVDSLDGASLIDCVEPNCSFLDLLTNRTMPVITRTRNKAKISDSTMTKTGANGSNAGELKNGNADNGEDGIPKEQSQTQATLVNNSEDDSTEGKDDTGTPIQQRKTPSPPFETPKDTAKTLVVVGSLGRESVVAPPHRTSSEKKAVARPRRNQNDAESNPEPVALNGSTQHGNKRANSAQTRSSNKRLKLPTQAPPAPKAEVPVDKVLEPEEVKHEAEPLVGPKFITEPKGLKRESREYDRRACSQSLGIVLLETDDLDMEVEVDKKGNFMFPFNEPYNFVGKRITLETARKMHRIRLNTGNHKPGQKDPFMKTIVPILEDTTGMNVKDDGNNTREAIFLWEIQKGFTSEGEGGNVWLRKIRIEYGKLRLTGVHIHPQDEHLDEFQVAELAAVEVYKTFRRNSNRDARKEPSYWTKIAVYLLNAHLNYYTDVPKIPCSTDPKAEAALKDLRKTQSITGYVEIDPTPNGKRQFQIRSGIESRPQVIALIKQDLAKFDIECEPATLLTADAMDAAAVIDQPDAVETAEDSEYKPFSWLSESESDEGDGES